jgi:hypothetical protein
MKMSEYHSHAKTQAFHVSDWFKGGLPYRGSMSMSPFQSLLTRGDHGQPDSLYHSLLTFLLVVGVQVIASFGSCKVFQPVYFQLGSGKVLQHLKEVPTWRGTADVQNASHKSSHTHLQTYQPAGHRMLHTHTTIAQVTLDSLVSFAHDQAQVCSNTGGVVKPQPEHGLHKYAT